jgi:hypothetical protein
LSSSERDIGAFVDYREENLLLESAKRDVITYYPEYYFQTALIVSFASSMFMGALPPLSGQESIAGVSGIPVSVPVMEGANSSAGLATNIAPSPTPQQGSSSARTGSGTATSATAGSSARAGSTGRRTTSSGRR